MVHQQTASIRRQLSHTISHRTRETTMAAGLGGLLDGVAPMGAATREADLRASFQVFHELVLLQQLITVVQTTWGPPQQWTLDQYQQLVQSICLAQEKLGSAAVDTNSILADAFALRYQFEEIPEKQAALMEAVGSPGSSEKTSPKPEPTRLPDLFASTLPRLRCPTIYGYYDTFEQLSRISMDDRLSTTPRESGGDAKLPLTPRSTTLAKYAQLYLGDDVRTRPPWSWERAEGDDLLDLWSSSEDSGDQYVLRHLAGRFDDDRIYTYVNNHTMVFLNPYRILQTSKFTSIYDEQVVLTYAQTSEAQSQLAPHPYAMAKQSLFRLFHRSKAQDTATPTQTFLLSGESGSGKTELAKELLKYFVLTAQPRLAGSDGKRSPKIQLFTSSTMSTLRMRTEETRSIALLEAKGVDDYEIVLLDLHPERWSEMTSVSRSKRLPQIHVDGMFFGFYEDLEHLEEEEQLRMYFKNPHAAKKLSTVLDSNILLEAFGNATTSMNLNSSRFGKTTTLFLSFDHRPAEFQVLGCSLTPFLLEKSRVTSGKTVSSEMNFHIFYAMVAGVNAASSMRPVAKELQLDGCTSDSFAYLGQHQHKLFGTWTVEETAKKDVERYQNIIATMKDIGLSQDHQKAIFKILSAILWLGNVDFEWNTTTLKLEMNGSAPQKIIALLGLDSIERLEQILFSKRLDMSATGESFDVRLEKGQVYHLRDTLARLLYEIVFYYIVARLNQVTKVDERDSRSASIKHLDIVDVFGFENLSRNSLEQLCINYLSEKLFASELSVVASQYGDLPSSLPSKRDVLFAFEHSVGIFASLEELTLLHQAENENALQEMKKNQLVVRNLYDRNGEWLEDSKRAASKLRKDLSLIFIVRHSKESVVYDAHEFVKKNTDFQYSTLREGLRRSANAQIVEILSVNKGSSSSSGKSSSNTLVSQFRSRTNDLTSRHTGSSIPLYLHCIRSNGNAQPSTIEKDSVNLQLVAHHLASQVQICGGSLYFSMQMNLDAFTSRFRPLFPKPQDHFDVTNVETLAQWVSTLLYDEEARPTQREMASRIKVENASILFSSMELLEGLDLALLACQSRASVQIQSLFRMIGCRTKFLSVQKKRKDLTNELYDLYGQENTAKVQRLLKKYQDKEDELRAKVMAKKKALREEELGITRLAAEIESACISSDGGLNAEMVNEILRNDEMRQMLQDNERIVLALREMSLNPQALPSQLADPLLRSFYENVLSIVQTRVLAPKQVRERTMEERVQDLLQHSKNKWTQAAADDRWKEHRDKLEEIGDDPEMLVFYSDDEAFATVLAEFVEFLARVEAGEPFEESAVNVVEQEREIVRSAVFQPQGSIEERVREVLEHSKAVWSSVAKHEQWHQLRDKLEEIGEDHEMLLFYLDDAEFSVKLAEFTAQVEAEAAQHALVAAAEAQDAHEADIEKELTEMLLKVEFNAELMGAMQQDPYFASSLQNPMLIATMQQVRCSFGQDLRPCCADQRMLSCR